FDDVACQGPPIAVINVTPRVVLLPSNSSLHSPGFEEIFLQLLRLRPPQLYMILPTQLRELIYDVLDLVPLWSLVKCRHRYAISSLMDAAYWMSEHTKGHYAQNCPKPRVRDSKYFMQQMLLAKKDEAGVILSNEQNDFLIIDAAQLEEIEKLSANICMMA
ncbi:hypothetical protein Tco_1510847, partial [Tanacetum coccineum]